MFVPCRSVLCRVWSPSPQDHRICLHLQLCHCWGICGIFHRLEPDPGVPDWHCSWGQCSEQHVWLTGKPHHQPLDGGQRGDPQWSGWDCYTLSSPCKLTEPNKWAHLKNSKMPRTLSDAFWSLQCNFSSWGNYSNFHRSITQMLFTTHSTQPYLTQILGQYEKYENHPYSVYRFHKMAPN